MKHYWSIKCVVWLVCIVHCFFSSEEEEEAESEEEGEDPTLDSLSQAIAFQVRLHLVKWLIQNEGHLFNLFWGFFVSPASPNGRRRETEVARCVSINFRLSKTKDKKKCILQWWGRTKWLITSFPACKHKCNTNSIILFHGTCCLMQHYCHCAGYMFTLLRTVGANIHKRLLLCIGAFCLLRWEEGNLVTRMSQFYFCIAIILDLNNVLFCQHLIQKYLVHDDIFGYRTFHC